MAQLPDFLGRGWAFPLATQAGKIALSANEVNIQESILIILQTPKGQRLMRPDFGCELDQLVFAPNNAATISLAKYYVTQSIDAWEPRVELQNVEVTISNAEPNKLLIAIDYIVRETNVPVNLVYPFYLQG